MTEENAVSCSNLTCTLDVGHEGGHVDEVGDPFAGDFQHEVKFRPAYDHRDDKDGGANGMEMWLIFRGSKGAVTCSIMTGWMLRPISDPQWSITHYRSPRRADKPGVDVALATIYPIEGYPAIHALSGPGTGRCEFLDDQPCDVDRFHVRSSRILKALIYTGDGVWAEMRKIYDEAFESDVCG